MKCPLCKTVELVSTALERELPASVCPKCGGTWLSSTHYWAWLEKQEFHVERKSIPNETLPVVDSKGAKICCECGGILLRYHVGKQVSFAIEHCGRCNGFWLDKNEWEVLKAHNLHDELNLVFSTDWQKGIWREDYERKVHESSEKQREEYERKMREAYEKRFGAELYSEIKRIRDWLDKQPSRAALLSFLNETETERK
jgi:Zn-finger nucleic acid-binding protein